METIAEFLDRALMDGCCNRVVELRNVWGDRPAFPSRNTESSASHLQKGSAEERLEREMRAAGFEELKPGTREAEQWAAYTGKGLSDAEDASVSKTGEAEAGEGG